MRLCNVLAYPVCCFGVVYYKCLAFSKADENARQRRMVLSNRAHKTRKCIILIRLEKMYKRPGVTKRI